MSVTDPVFCCALDRLVDLLRQAERCGLDLAELAAAAVDRLDADGERVEQDRPTDIEALKAALPAGAQIFNMALTPADRQRLKREREAAGLAVLTIEVPFFELTEALVEDGYLKPEDCESRQAAARAIEEMLREFTESHA